MEIRVHILFLQDQQDMIDSMMDKVIDYPNGTWLRIIWASRGVIVEGSIDTVYETDNGLDMEDSEYDEFYACAIRIEKVIGNLQEDNISPGNLMELSKSNPPSRIELKDGTLIWESHLSEMECRSVELDRPII